MNFLEKREEEYKPALACEQVFNVHLRLGTSVSSLAGRNENLTVAGLREVCKGSGTN